jgi:hypothetical protein
VGTLKMFDFQQGDSGVAAERPVLEKHGVRNHAVQQAHFTFIPSACSADNAPSVCQ